MIGVLENHSRLGEGHGLMPSTAVPLVHNATRVATGSNGIQRRANTEVIGESVGASRPSGATIVAENGITNAAVSEAIPRFFITVDAETKVIGEGIAAIASIREEVEARENVRIPIVWFVRFQRTLGEYVGIDSPKYFAGPVTTAFDGYELAREELLGLAARGDEIGWHYHANNYVRRTHLSHAQRMDILKEDLVACAHAMRTWHPYFEISSFRFGWFFIPDYAVFTTLASVGIRADASIHPDTEGQRVGKFEVTHLPTLTRTPKMVRGMFFFPYFNTRLIHDYSVVPHDFSWSRLDADGARRNQEGFKRDLSRIATHVKEGCGALTTYRAMTSVGLTAPARWES